jgi:hypothetical protein
MASSRIPVVFDWKSRPTDNLDVLKFRTKLKNPDSPWLSRTLNSGSCVRQAYKPSFIWRHAL